VYMPFAGRGHSRVLYVFPRSFTCSMIVAVFPPSRTSVSKATRAVSLATTEAHIILASSSRFVSFSLVASSRCESVPKSQTVAVSGKGIISCPSIFRGCGLRNVRRILTSTDVPATMAVILARAIAHMALVSSKVMLQRTGRASNSLLLNIFFF
jgi:hypothetical protein